MKSIRDELYRVMSPGSHLYLFCAIIYWHDLWSYYDEVFDVRPMPLIWDKLSGGYCPTPRNSWARQYECILFAKKGKRDFNANAVIKTGEGDILEYRAPIGSNRLGLNEKPLSLVRDLIELSSALGETILDPFCGTGPVGAACIILGRKPVLIDKNPLVLDIARERIQKEMERLEKQRG